VLAELQSSVGSDVWMGLAQAVGAIAICTVVVVLCRWNAIRVEREAAVAMARGLVQMVLVGLVLASLLHSSLLVGSLILLMMTVAAAATAARRLPEIDGALLLCFWAIAAGAGTAIAAMLATRSLRGDISILVPVGSMMIANAMNACAQALERFRADILGHAGEIEAGLSLGADPAVSVAPYLQSAVYASLLPRLDMLKSLGLVWIPGVMAGMMLSGTSPVYAAIYQFVIAAMILTASGIAGLVATVLMRSRVFSSAAQLTLRPAPTSASDSAAVDGPA
jgi:putative ABC transport system permease protein